MIDDLIGMIGSFQNKMRKNIPFLEESVEQIILNNEKSTSRIENLLDTLLDYSSMGLGIEQFKRLNSYYHTINPPYSAEYDKFFREIFDEE